MGKASPEELTFLEFIAGVIAWAHEYGVNSVLDFNHIKWYKFIREVWAQNDSATQSFVLRIFTNDIFFSRDQLMIPYQEELHHMYASLEHNGRIYLKSEPCAPTCKLGILYPHLILSLVKLFANNYLGDRMPALPGIYRHYKNHQSYQVFDVARHEHTGERLVFYKALYGQRLSWVRPINDFLAVVTSEDGTKVPRFTRTA